MKRKFTIGTKFFVSMCTSILVFALSFRGNEVKDWHRTTVFIVGLGLCLIWERISPDENA